MVHFGEFLTTWSLRSDSVTRQVNFNRTKIGEKCQNAKNLNATFWVIFKQCEVETFKLNWFFSIQWNCLDVCHLRWVTMEFQFVKIPVYIQCPKLKSWLIAQSPAQCLRCNRGWSYMLLPIQMLQIWTLDFQRRPQSQLTSILTLGWILWLKLGDTLGCSWDTRCIKWQIWWTYSSNWIGLNTVNTWKKCSKILAKTMAFKATNWTLEIILTLKKYSRCCTLFENYSKCRIWIFEFWQFPPILVLLKVTCLVTLFDRKLQFFGIFN